MRSTKLLTLTMLPLVLLMVVPFSTHAQSNTYYLRVECDASSRQADVATLVFLGHSLVVNCPAGTGFHEKQVSIGSEATGTYYAQLIAGGQYQFQLGTFGPNTCFVEGVQYGTGYSSWAYFDIHTSFCD